MIDPTSPLEDQRDFLLRSLEDLEREHAAGDVDEHDYRALKDDYTARAARVLRSLEAGQTTTAAVAGRRRSPGRKLVALAAVVAFAVLAGVLVGQAAGRRDPGDTATGDVRQSTSEKLREAQRRASEGEYDDAIELYDEVIVDDPTNVEALTYRGWTLFLDEDEEALPALVDATTVDPNYPDAHAFLAVLFFRLGLYEQSRLALDRLDQLDPPAEMQQLTDGLRAQVESVLASTTTSSTVSQAGGGM
jgi:tetratricopeptide (TPR) repeat protein